MSRCPRSLPRTLHRRPPHKTRMFIINQWIPPVPAPKAPPHVLAFAVLPSEASSPGFRPTWCRAGRSGACWFGVCGAAIGSGVSEGVRQGGVWELPQHGNGEWRVYQALRPKTRWRHVGRCGVWSAVECRQHEYQRLKDLKI